MYERSNVFTLPHLSACIIMLIPKIYNCQMKDFSDRCVWAAHDVLLCKCIYILKIKRFWARLKDSTEINCNATFIVLVS